MELNLFFFYISILNFITVKYTIFFDSIFVIVDLRSELRRNQ